MLGQKIRIRLQLLALLAAMAALLAAIGWVIAGWPGVAVTVVFGFAFLAVGREMSSRALARALGAVRLDRAEAPTVFALADELAGRAGFAVTPALSVVERDAMVAFTVGDRAETAVVSLSAGMLARLTLRELAGVLAHEFSHIVHRDIPLMVLADAATRMTRALSLGGLVLIAFNLPLYVTGEAAAPWVALALLAVAPTLGVLLQMALSRNREFDADRNAVTLTGDPIGLASALQKIEAQQVGFWGRLFPFHRRGRSEPSLLRSHPVNHARIARLLGMPPSGRVLPAGLLYPAEDMVVAWPRVVRVPAWRGLWWWR